MLPLTDGNKLIDITTSITVTVVIITRARSKDGSTGEAYDVVRFYLQLEKVHLRTSYSSSLTKTLEIKNRA